ncbi:MAG: CPBP family intramembrane metalloprotease [Pyrinomonadaceae bacterium]|nr:CPBP family intramembrane metalloprotease [Pyrinomonadaceae bacterium]
METIQLIFIGKDGQLRSGWRAGVFLFGFIFFSVILGTIVQAIMFTANFESASLQSISLAANAVAALIPAIVIGWLCGKWLEKLPFGALGASFSGSWIRNFVLGIVTGGATLSFAVLVAFAFGGQRFELNLANGWQPVLTSLAVSFGVFAAAAAMEEALFRGYILQTFARSNLAWLAILLTSVFFGLVHADNPNAGVISTLNTVLAGIWFSVAYLKTRDLWFVWGLHLMWNWMQGSFFGIEVSGLTDITKNPLLREIDTGPTWLTGTTYGIEGGIVCTVALVISTIVIHFFPGKTNHIET